MSYTNEMSTRDATIAERNMDLETAEKEARDLQLAIREEKRQIDLRKKEMLQEKWLEGEIAMLQIEVGEKQTHPDMLMLRLGSVLIHTSVLL